MSVYPNRTCHAVLVERLYSVCQQPPGAQHVGDNDGLEGVQLKVPGWGERRSKGW
jgi:hypothetical protein